MVNDQIGRSLIPSRVGEPVKPEDGAPRNNWVRRRRRMSSRVDVRGGRYRCMMADGGDDADGSQGDGGGEQWYDNQMTVKMRLYIPNAESIHQ